MADRRPREERERRFAARPNQAPPTKGIVVLGNLKGGCGKSTVVFNLAVWLATAGNRPILVDLDPQRTLSDLVAVREEIGALAALDAPLHELPRLEGD